MYGGMSTLRGMGTEMGAVAKLLQGKVIIKRTPSVFPCEYTWFA